MAVLLLLAAGSKTFFEVALTLNSHISILTLHSVGIASSGHYRNCTGDGGLVETL